METLRIVLILLCFAFACVIVRLYCPEYAIVLNLCIGACTLFCLLPQLRQIADMFFSFDAMGASVSSFSRLVLKIIGIAYLAQFAADTCIDCGEKALAQKVTFAARTGILVLCLPTVGTILELLFLLLDGVP